MMSKLLPALFDSCALCLRSCAFGGRPECNPEPPRLRRPMRAGVIHPHARPLPHAVRWYFHAAVFDPEVLRACRVGAIKRLVDIKMPRHIARPDHRLLRTFGTGEHAADENALRLAVARGAEIEQPVDSVAK